jgi:hypothetical protein
MTVRATWKAYELRCAKALGGRRIPVTGIDRAGADVVSDMFFYQVKLRKSIPSWLGDWLSGIVGTASDQGKVGVLVLRRPRQEDADALVVLRFSDWRDLHGEVRDRSGHT